MSDGNITLDETAKTAQGDVAAEILAMGGTASKPGTPDGATSGDAGPASSPTPSAPNKRAFRIKEPSKLNKKHREFLEHGGHPEDLVSQHIPRGFWGRCGCSDCVTKRGEWTEEPPVVSAAPGGRGPASMGLGDLFTEKFCAAILNLPNKFMQMTAKVKGFPTEAVKLWDTDAEDLKIYGEYGKRLADYYLALPDFKHKELILFTAWYMSNFGIKLATMNAMMKKEAPHAEQ